MTGDTSSSIAGTGLQRGDVLGVFTERRTYRNMLYLWLSFSIGMVAIFLFTFGFAFGIALSVIGIALLLATLVAVRWWAAVERWLANALLDVTLVAPGDVARPRGAPFVPRLRGLLEAPSTWRALGFVGMRFWMGLVGLIVGVVLPLTALSLIVSPFTYESDVATVELFGWTSTTLLEAILAVSFGALLLVVTAHLINATGWAFGRMATSLLGPPASGSSRPTESES